jgi:hypothetical protein
MTRLIGFFIVISILFSVDVFGQITTKGGLKVNLYMTGSKKPVTNEELSDGIRGEFGRYKSLIERLVIKKKSKNSVTNENIEIEVYQYKELEDGIECIPKITGEKTLLLRKNLNNIEFDNKSKDYTLPVYPWLDYDGNYLIVVRDGEEIIQVNYCIIWLSGY